MIFERLTILGAIETLEPDLLAELAECLLNIAHMPPEQRGRAFKAATALFEAAKPIETGRP